MDGLTVEELLAARKRHRAAVRNSVAALAVLVVGVAFYVGCLVGHARTNCGEVYRPDGSHSHECWWIGSTDDAE